MHALRNSSMVATPLFFTVCAISPVAIFSNPGTPAMTMFGTFQLMSFSHCGPNGIFIGMLGLPGFIWKLVALALIWAYLHHFIAGLRHLYMDATHRLSNEFGKSTALVTLALSIALTLVLGAKLFGLY